MGFLLKPWLIKTIKGIITALVAYVTGPKLVGVLQQFGIAVDPTQAQAGLFALYVSAANWLKHQKWFPKELVGLL